MEQNIGMSISDWFSLIALLISVWRLIMCRLMSVQIC